MIGWKEEVYGDAVAVDLATLIYVNAIILGSGQGANEAADQHHQEGGKEV